MRKTFVILLLAINSAVVFGDETNYSLEPILVTAKRFTSSLDAVPVITTVISAQQIEKSAATNLQRLLESEAGINVADLFGISGSKSSVDMGGFGASGGLNTLVLLNGRRLNDVDLSGANLASIALESIERIEIIHGTSAVLFGDNAVGGVINIVTKSGFKQQRSQLTLQQGSYRTMETAFNSQGSFDKNSFSITLNSSTSNGYRDNSSFENTRVAGELAFDQESWLWGARLFGSQEELQLPGELNEPDYESDPTQSGTGALETSKEDRYAVEAFMNGKHFAGEFAVSDKHQEAFIYGDTTADLTTISLTPRYSRHFANQHFITGLDIYHSDLDTEALFDTAKNQSNATRKSYALYATDTVSFNNQIQLELGARYQQVKLDITNKDLLTASENADHSKDGLTAWDIAVSHKLASGMRNYIRLASSFRFPVLDEVWNYFYGTISLLEPQTSRHIELGSDYPINNAVTLKANMFRMKVKNEISYDDSQYANVNLESTQHDGIDLNLRWHSASIYTLTTVYGYRDAIFTFGANDGKHIPLIPRHKLSLNNQFDVKHIGIFNLNAIYTGERYFGDDNANIGKKMSAYTKVDVSYLRDFGGWKGKVSIFNVTNEKTANRGYYRSYYANPYNYYPLPERSIFVSLEGSF
ncbi:TonB-dependent receptor [Kaarinaea lacus]